MAEDNRRDRGVSSTVAIPSGLNRIKTRLASSGPRPEDFSDKPPFNRNQKSIVPRGHGRTTSSSKQGTKLSRWLASYKPKYPCHPPKYVCSSSEDAKLKVKNSCKVEERMVRVSETALPSSKSMGIKSFSHELGPRGGVQTPYPRPHSYNDLKELLGSLHSRFDVAKETVDKKLNDFVIDVKEAIEKMDPSCPEDREMVEELLNLARACMEMTSAQLRASCESIVQDLTRKRKQCQAGLVKWLFSQLLFILTHCTRVVMFQKETEPIDESSFRKFKECLDRIPALETDWATPRVDDSGSGYPKYQRNEDGKKFKRQDKESLESETTFGSAIPVENSNNADTEGYAAAKQVFPSQKPEYDSKVVEQRFYSSDESEDKMPNEPGKELGGSDYVICRICEEEVPLSHLEPHSYICAYADKCEINCLDVDERLLKLEEILEQIIDSRSLNSFTQAGGLENSVLQKSGVASEGCSPKMNEWRNKGVEGMFEDLHEMDTAFIDESSTYPINLKSHVGAKLCHHGTSSSTGSITSVSSTNTPRTSHFDSYWLERHCPEQEDLQLMMDLSDIARCGASTDLSKEGSCDYLMACMQDIQAVLKQGKLKALVIDTFGGRIEKLLCEKYIYARELTADKSSAGNVKESEEVVEHAVATPHLLLKDRISIDEFEIIKPISRGAFGKVFLARKRTTGDFFAIKVLKKLDMIRKNDIERILQERNILITVRYPFLVRFFYSFTCRDNLYLVMEYLNGGDLYSLLQKVGCLDEEIARIYIAELVLALEYLHSQKIVHRDLKPDNLLIAYNGHIKLTDFGLSKIGLINNTIDLSGNGSDASPRISSHDFQKNQEEERIRNSAVGTPDYLAPEILLGTEHGYASDWWSVGIVLFELITGIPPFTAARPEIIFDNILNGKMPWPDVPGEMSYEAQNLINRLLVHEPEKRLGANGAAEVKSHPFFRGVDWDNLALQKAAFVPQPESIADTSYFVSRFCENSCSDSETDNNSESFPDSGDELDECTNLEKFDSPPYYLSLINFSFKNLSQLASINHDVLLQKDPAKGGGDSPFKSHGT
ncbi:PREDICTED: probable serine/threonine protein kinase IRE4 isoform X1 [Camelina sativa]|uniref:non-specific serine/threonine protein kinase n=1 Tax=Camelina sativa TaxID=90675 RepID=A0ABM0X147_CAMSA|nr:PREDICTED: probable serine/threonine protein kinase IRE4 isoform X1 [Camelina sativa]